MKRLAIVNLWKVISKMEGKMDTRLNYLLVKNKIALKPEIEALEQTSKPRAEFLEFESKRVEAAHKYCDKEEDGKPKVFNNQYVIMKNREVFESEIKTLKDKYTEAIQYREKQVYDYEKLLNEEIVFTPTKIKFSYLPPQIESNVLEVFIEADIIEDDIDVK